VVGATDAEERVGILARMNLDWPLCGADVTPPLTFICIA
jgi:hypothetical protein